MSHLLLMLLLLWLFLIWCTLTVVKGIASRVIIVFLTNTHSSTVNTSARLVASHRWLHSLNVAILRLLLLLLLWYLVLLVGVLLLFELD